MKTNALKSYVRSQGSMALIEHQERQWLLSGTAAYPLDGWPHTSGAEMMTLMDIPKDEQATYPMREYYDGEAPEALLRTLADTDPGERQATEARVRITAEGKSWVPLYTPAGMCFVDAEALKPLADVKKEMTLHYREREGQAGTVAVKVGMLVVGVIFCQSGFITDDVEEALLDVRLGAEKLATARRQREANEDRQLRMEGLG